MGDAGEIPVGGQRVLYKPQGGRMGTIRRTGPESYQAIGPGGNVLRTGKRRNPTTTFTDYYDAFAVLRYYHG